MVLLEEKSGDQQSQQDVSSGNHECLYKMTIHPTVFEIFQPTDWLPFQESQH